VRAVESPQVDRHPGLRELNDESAGVDPDVRQKFRVRIDPRLLCRARDYPHCDVAATPPIQDIDQFGAEFAGHRTTVTIGRRDGALDIRHLCLIY
jgi:hypothetical protein